MNKEATIKSALTPFLKDADIRKAMDIFHKDYADITPYQIQRFVHEITQDNETKEYRSNIRRSLMKALSDYQMGAVNHQPPQPMTHDIPNLGQNSPVTHPSSSQLAIANQKSDSISKPISSQIAAFELLIDSFTAQFSPLLGSQILDSVKQTIHQHHNSSKSRGFGLLARKAETNQALTLTMIHFFDQFFGGDKQSALTMALRIQQVLELSYRYFISKRVNGRVLLMQILLWRRQTRLPKPSLTYLWLKNLCRMPFI